MLEVPNFLPDPVLEDFWKKDKKEKKKKVKETKGGGDELFLIDGLSLKHLRSVKVLREGKLGCDRPALLSPHIIYMLVTKCNSTLESKSKTSPTVLHCR